MLPKIVKRAGFYTSSGSKKLTRIHNSKMTLVMATMACLSKSSPLVSYDLNCFPSWVTFLSHTAVEIVVCKVCSQTFNAYLTAVSIWITNSKIQYDSLMITKGISSDKKPTPKKFYPTKHITGFEHGTFQNWLPKHSYSTFLHDTTTYNLWLTHNCKST